MFSGPSWDKAVLCLSLSSLVCLLALLQSRCLSVEHSLWQLPWCRSKYIFFRARRVAERKKNQAQVGGKTNRREAVSTCWLFQCLFVYPPYRHLPRDLCLWDFFVITLRRQVENGIASRRVFDVLSKRFYWPWLNIAFRRTAYRHSESTSDRQERMEKKREGDEGG